MCRLKVRVTANSYRPGMVALVGNVLHLKVASPPIDNRANRELCEMLAGVLKLAPSLVTVRFGHLARLKTVEVMDIDEQHALAILRQFLSSQLSRK